MKPELASLLSVAMTTAAVSSASLRMKKRARRTCGRGLHPLGEFTAPTWQPKIYIINLFKWEPKQLVRQSSSILLPFTLSFNLFPPLSCVAFSQRAAGRGSGRVAVTGRCRSRLSRLFPECHSAGPSSPPLPSPPPPASLSGTTADSLSHVGSWVKRFCCLCTCSHLI